MRFSSLNIHPICTEFNPKPQSHHSNFLKTFFSFKNPIHTQKIALHIGKLAHSYIRVRSASSKQASLSLSAHGSLYLYTREYLHAAVVGECAPAGKRALMHHYRRAARTRLRYYRRRARLSENSLLPKVGAGVDIAVMYLMRRAVENYSSGSCRPKNVYACVLYFYRRYGAITYTTFQTKQSANTLV